MIEMTDALKIRMQARRLLVEHAPAGANWLSWALQLEYLNLSIAQRPKTFSEYVIQELSK